MFTLSRTYDGGSLPVDMLYFDASAGTLTVAGLTLSADVGGETLLLPSVVTGTFDGAAFPLLSDDFLSPVTGDLILTYAGNLTTGIYTYPLRIQTGLWQGFGGMMWSGAGFGVGGQGEQVTFPLLYLSVLSLPTAAVNALATVPDSAWHSRIS